MRRPWIIGNLLIGGAWASGCTEHDVPTAVLEEPTVGTLAGGASSTGSGVQSSFVLDPVGDIKSKFPAFSDIVRAEISLERRTYTFVVDLAGPLPDIPDIKPFNHADIAMFGLDADPTTSPAGYPFDAGVANPLEFFVGVVWDPTGGFGLGNGYLGFILDRRPLLTGGEAVLTPMEFTIDGSRVTMHFDSKLLPATFAWIAFTDRGKEAHPTSRAEVVDGAPDNVGLVQWPPP